MLSANLASTSHLREEKLKMIDTGKGRETYIDGDDCRFKLITSLFHEWNSIQIWARQT